MVVIDYPLLYLRSENGRRSLKEIAQYLKKSSQRVKYNLAILEKEKLILDPYCLFDYSYFGLILFRVYFKGGYSNDADKEKIIRELAENDYILSIYELTGEFDLGVEFAAPNPSKFNKELKKIITLTPTLNDYKIVLNLVSYVYPRKYLVSNSNLEDLTIERIIGGDRERDEFTKAEMIVMKNLLLKPNSKMTELAKKTELNVKTAKSIIKNLTRRNIIKGFKYNLNTNQLEIYKFRLFLKLHYVSPEREKMLMEFMLKTQSIVQVNKTLGDWDLEIDLESLDKNRARQMIMQLREEFKDLIERFNLIEFYQYYKRSYLPLYLFKEE